jgi:hypothetical protein
VIFAYITIQREGEGTRVLLIAPPGFREDKRATVFRAVARACDEEATRLDLQQNDGNFPGQMSITEHQGEVHD